MFEEDKLNGHETWFNQAGSKSVISSVTHGAQAW